MYIYLNGEFLLTTDARISILDRGFLYGDGVFETMRAYSKQIFKLDAHLYRLFTGMERLQIDNHLRMDNLKYILYQLLRLNNLSDAYIRLTISRGSGGRGLDITGCDKPTIVVNTRKFCPYPEGYYRNGISVNISQTRQNCRSILDSSIKSISFLNNILARIELSKKDAFETLLLNNSGYLTEGTVSNIFFVFQGKLCTPSIDAGILRGITRETVLEIAEREKIELREGLFTVEELYQADEIFITNTMIEVLPVTTIDNYTLKIGDITRRIITAYREVVHEELLSS